MTALVVACGATSAQAQSKSFRFAEDIKFNASPDYD